MILEDSAVRKDKSKDRHTVPISSRTKGKEKKEKGVNVGSGRGGTSTALSTRLTAESAGGRKVILGWI